MVIREIKIKAMRYHCIPMRMSKIKQTDSTKCWGQDVEKLELIHGGNVKWHNHSGKQFGIFFKSYTATIWTEVSRGLEH